jgi:hypothetical protein
MKKGADSSARRGCLVFAEYEEDGSVSIELADCLREGDSEWREETFYTRLKISPEELAESSYPDELLVKLGFAILARINSYPKQ